MVETSRVGEGIAGLFTGLSRRAVAMGADEPADDRVLVGVDGSPASVEALREGARIAEALGAPLEAVIVWAYPAAEFAVGAWDLDEAAASLLDRAIVEAFGDEPPTIRKRVLAGPTAHTLIVESKRAGMLVLGSRGHGGFAGLRLGSVSAACTAHAHCPVLVVRPRSVPAAD